MAALKEGSGADKTDSAAEASAKPGFSHGHMVRARPVALADWQSKPLSAWRGNGMHACVSLQRLLFGEVVPRKKEKTATNEASAVRASQKGRVFRRPLRLKFGKKNRATNSTALVKPCLLRSQRKCSTWRRDKRRGRWGWSEATRLFPPFAFPRSLTPTRPVCERVLSSARKETKTRRSKCNAGARLPLIGV